MNPGVTFLLDEHYPPRLRDLLAGLGVVAVTLTHDRPALRGKPDDEVLRLAAAEGQVVVTEDVGTFMAAVTLVPDHRGVVFCHHRRFPRTPTGLVDLSRALAALAAAPPPGLGEAPVIWWLGAPSRRSTRSPDTEIGERPVCADPRKPKTPPVGPVK